MSPPYEPGDPFAQVTHIALDGRVLIVASCQNMSTDQHLTPCMAPFLDVYIEGTAMAFERQEGRREAVRPRPNDPNFPWPYGWPENGVAPMITCMAASDGAVVVGTNARSVEFWHTERVGDAVHLVPES